MQVESTDFPIQNVELMPSNSTQTAYTPAPMAAQCQEDRPPQIPQPQWPKPTYMPADANARIAAQYAEETMHDDASIRSGCINVSTGHTTVRRANETMATHQITLRRSNVDGDFYPQEFGHEEVVRTMDEDRSQTSSLDKLWKKKALEVFPNRAHPDTQYGSSFGRDIRGIAERPGRSLQNVRAQEMAEPPQSPTSSLRERALPSTRVQELVELPRVSNGSLRERSLPSERVQELAEPHQPKNSSEPCQAHPMDELIRLAAQLNRHLEVGISGLKAQRCGPTDEQYSPRFIESGMPSVVRPVYRPVHHPDVRPQTPLCDMYGHPRGSYIGENPASRPHATETPEAFYHPARVDKEREVLSSNPRPTPVTAFHAGMQEVQTVMPEQRQVYGFSCHSEEGPRQMTDRPVVQFSFVMA